MKIYISIAFVTVLSCDARNEDYCFPTNNAMLQKAADAADCETYIFIGPPGTVPGRGGWDDDTVEVKTDGILVIKKMELPDTVRSVRIEGVSELFITANRTEDVTFTDTNAAGNVRGHISFTCNDGKSCWLAAGGDSIEINDSPEGTTSAAFSGNVPVTAPAGIDFWSFFDSYDYTLEDVQSVILPNQGFRLSGSAADGALSEVEREVAAWLAELDYVGTLEVRHGSDFAAIDFRDPANHPAE
jgi:hypothetical protein